MPEVKVANLSKRFGDNAVLRDITFTIADGEFFTLLGPSGCGKSTTLACIAGLERPTGGTVAVGDTTFAGAGTFVPPEGRNLGMVFQSYALWPHMTVAQNLAMPLKIRKVDRREQDTLITEALAKVGLAEYRDRYPHQLSGGQQQRVALARALVYSPSVLLLDEPLSNLDAKLRDQARAWLKRLQTELGITTVYVTHDQDEALALSDRIAVMSKGDMVQIGTPQEIYETPATAEVAAFVGRCNFLTGTKTGPEEVRLDCTGQSITVPSSSVEGAGDVGGRVTVAVRPERLEIVSTGRAGVNVLTAQVLTSSYVGSRHEYDLRLGDHVIQVESNRPGLTGEVTLVVEPEACRLYPSTDALPEDVAALTTVSH
ncbi:iron(III) transport system ATP-binding protein [Nonomuraea solani]|uniref:ABC-type quaternary amine transporter n=1 Tax=Nonomuraea solani TaxID=1144553 RepID=A0A1H6F1F4_9ACTN|nr:ABC transporter ATP-binding protein [Nonomuraea solani]SEH03988.1 iron(III) transport system ATP-binding protein [Nonomuraea solani]